MDAREVLLGNVALTWALVGLIWTIQLVQYPGFALVGQREFARYHEHHASRITWVVAPLMGGELVTSGLLLLDRPAGLSSAAAWVGFALVGVTWLVTAAVSVPLHGRLACADRRALAPLVSSNWIRTAAWSARGIWALVVLREVTA